MKPNFNDQISRFVFLLQPQGEFTLLDRICETAIKLLSAISILWVCHISHHKSEEFICRLVQLSQII